VLLQTQRQRFDAARRQPRLVWGLDGAEGLADKSQTVKDALVARGNRAANGGVMALDVLGGGEHRDIRAEIERTQQQRREEGVVHHQSQIGGPGDVGNGRDIGEFECRIRRGLDEDHAGGRLDRSLYGFGIRRIDEARFNTEVTQHLIEEPHGAAVDDIRQDDVIARLEQSEEDGRDCRHAGRETDCRRRVFKGSQCFFERGDSGIRGARIGVPLVNAHGVLAVGGGLIDRRQHSAGGRVGMHAAADRRNHRGTLGGVCTRGERFRLLAWTADRLGFAWP